MERAEQVILQCGLKPDVTGYVMVEQLIDIESIGSVRRRGHTEQESRPEIFNDLMIALGTGTVALIEYDD